MFKIGDPEPQAHQGGRPKASRKLEKETSSRRDVPGATMGHGGGKMTETKTWDVKRRGRLHGWDMKEVYMGGELKSGD